MKNESISALVQDYSLLTEEVRLDLTDLKTKNTPNENPIKDQSKNPMGTNGIGKPYFSSEQMKPAIHSFEDDD